MRRSAVALWGILCVLASGLCFSDLQNIEVGGKIEVYGGRYSRIYERGDEGAIRMPPDFLDKRPIGPSGTISFVGAGDETNNYDFWQQRTRLRLNADLTDDVSAFIEFDSINNDGAEGFRSDWITGADFRPSPADHLALFQAYVEVANLFGKPLSLRMGRQELEFGSGWLVGADPGPNPFTGLSFDAIRLTYAEERFSLDAWWSKIGEGSLAGEDDDVDFFGLYFSIKEPTAEAAAGPFHVHDTICPTHLVYHGVRKLAAFSGSPTPEKETAEFDLYWMGVRDATRRIDTEFEQPVEWFEDLFRLDNYDVTWLNVVGTRGAGCLGPLDWQLEVAYEWGNADAVGALFIPNGDLYGDDDARWNTWGGHAEAGYTLDVPWSPRIFLGGAYYGGEDNRDISFVEWLSPFSRSEASVSFNRLFSSVREEWFIDISGMSNFWKAYVGLGAAPIEAVELNVDLTYLAAVETFDNPAYVSLAGWRVPIAPDLSFWTKEGSKDLGWQVSLSAVYHYSEDLSLEVGWAHFFVGDAIADGVVFIDDYGLTNIGGRSGDDVEFAYFYATLEF